MQKQYSGLLSHLLLSRMKESYVLVSEQFLAENENEHMFSNSISYSLHIIMRTIFSTHYNVNNITHLLIQLQPMPLFHCPFPSYP